MLGATEQNNTGQFFVQYRYKTGEVKMANVTKLYAAYKTGFLGDNILDTYFSFLANLLIENKAFTVDENEVLELFEDRYNFSLPLPFIR